MVETVLGLSLTSTSIGWLLLDGPDADANTLDHDAFDLGAGSTNDGDTSKHTAAVRGAQSIAAASGHHVKSIGVTWTDDADAKATLLLKSLPDLGFDNVVSVKLSEATRAWARAYGRTLGFEKCAMCVVESAGVTALSFGYDSVRTFTTQMRESADGLSRWLNEVFEKNKLQPDSLFLVGSRGDVELISGSLSEALPMPVIASDDAQLAFARGAALAVGPRTAAATVEQASDEPVDDKPTRRWPRFRQHAPVATLTKPDALESWTEVIKKPPRTSAVDDAPTQHQAAALVQHPPCATETDVVVETKADVVEAKIDIVEAKTDAAETNTAVVEAKTEVIENPVIENPVIENPVVEKPVVEKPVVEKPVVDEPVVDKQAIDAPVVDKSAKHQSWYGPHARAGTVVVAGVVALFVIVPTLTGPKESTPTEHRPASDAATTSVSVHAVPSPRAVPPAPAAVRQVAAEPAPVPPPPAALPPAEEVIAPATDSGGGQDTATRVQEPTRTPVTAQPLVAPQAPAAVQAPVAPQAPVAQPPAAQQPLAPPALPAETPPPAAPQPLVAPQAPLAPPALAPPPPAAPQPALAPPAPEAPPPGAPIPPPGAPPPDPVAVMLGPLFGALP